MSSKLKGLIKKEHVRLAPWERVAICRHPSRPRAMHFIQHLCHPFFELFGDRLYRDDPAMITGMGKIEGVKFMIVAQEKGNDTESRLKHNFGMSHPEGYRKALRCMKLAAKFHLPVLALIDTPGADPSLASEERGQGWAIAHNLMEMARLPTPIIAVLIGEGCSGGALGIGVADTIGMLEHAYYSVIAPEGCASILWRDVAKKEEAAKVLKMHVEDLLRFGIVDCMIAEPEGGAHREPSVVYSGVKEYVLKEWNRWKEISPQQLLEKRYQKYRKMGKWETHEATS